MKTKSAFLGVAAVLLILILPVDAADISTVFPPEEKGPYHIGFFEVSYEVPPYGRYTATVRYPAICSGWFAPADISGAPYPGIVVANGFAGAEWNIKWIPRHLTSYGYVTICFTPPRLLSGNTMQWASGMRGGIQKLKSQNGFWYSPLYGILDVQTFGAIGLSMGGGGCLKATAAPDSEIDAAVALAPAGGRFTTVAEAGDIKVPIQIQEGTEDGLIPPVRVLPYYTDLIPETTVKEYVAINGGNHIGFVDEYAARVAEWFGIDNPKGIEFDEQRRISMRYFTAWFQYYLKGLDEYYPYLFGEEAQADLNAGILSDLRFNVP